MYRKVGLWGGSQAIRIGSECKVLGIETGENVLVTINDGKIIIEPIKNGFMVVNGKKFEV